MFPATRRRFEHLLYLAIGDALAYVAQRIFYPGVWFTVLVVMAWIFVFSVWILVRMPTRCHYDVGPHGCTRWVSGKLGGCYQHSQLKRDAMWAAMKRRNPGLAFRITWGQSQQLGRQLGTDPEMSDRIAQQGAYNASMWWFAAISAIGTVVALIVAVSLKQ